MTFFNRNVNFDIGHLFLLAALVFLVFFGCKFICRGSEGLDVQKVHWKSCRCPTCAEVAYKQAQDGQLYGCNPNNPYVPYSPEECNYSYRKAMLHGCGIA